MHACFVLWTGISFLCFPFDADQLDQKKGRIHLGFVSVGCSLKGKMLDYSIAMKFRKKNDDQNPLSDIKHVISCESLSVTSVYSGGN